MHAQLRRKQRRRRVFRLVVVTLGLAVAGGIAFNLRLLLDPDEMRRRAVDQLEEMFEGPVAVGTADVELPGTVVLRNVRVAAPGHSVSDPSIQIESVRVGFSVIRSILGRRAPTRIELDGASLRVRRRRDGSLDIEDLWREQDAGGEPRPTSILVTNASVEYHDDNFMREGHDVRVKNVRVTVDPDGAIEGTAAIVGVGRVSIERGPTADPWMDLSLDGVRLEAPFGDWVSPEIAEQIRGFEMSGPARARFSSRGAAAELTVELLGNRIVVDPRAESIPIVYPLDDVQGTVRRRDGRWTIEGVEARHGPSRFRITGELTEGDDGGVEKLELHVAGTDVLVDQEIRDAVTPTLTEVLDAFDVNLVGNLDARITKRVGGDVVPRIRFTVRDGKMRYQGYENELDGVRRGFAYPIESLRGEIEFYRDTLTLSGIHGRRGDVLVDAGGTIRFESLSKADVDISIVAHGIRFDEDVARASETINEQILKRFRPEGASKRVHIHLVQSAEHDDRVYPRVTVDLDGVAMTPVTMPVRLENLVGRIRIFEESRDGEELNRVSIEGVRGIGPGDAAVRIDGSIRHWRSPEERAHVVIEIEKARLDAESCRILQDVVLPPEVAAVIETMEPRGTVDARVTLDDSPTDSLTSVIVRPHWVDIQGLPGVPFPLRVVAGLIEVDGDDVAMPWVTALAGDCRITAGGRLDADGSSAFTLRARDVEVTAALEHAIASALPGVDAVRRRFQPVHGSRFDLEVDFIDPADAASSLDLALLRPRLDLRPGGDARLRLNAGKIELDPDTEIIHLRGVAGTLNGSAIRVDDARVEPDGSIHARVESDPLAPIEDLSWLLSRTLLERIEDIAQKSRIALSGVSVYWSGKRAEVSGRIALHRPEGSDSPSGTLRVERLDVDLDGDRTTFSGVAELEEIRLSAGLEISAIAGRLAFTGSDAKKFRLDGSLAGLTFTVLDHVTTDSTATLRIDQDYLELRDLIGVVDGGSVRTGLKLHLGEPRSVELSAKLRNVSLERFLADPGSPPRTDVTGLLDVDLDLEHWRTGLENLSGKGELRIREGRLWDIKLFSAIIRALTAVPPVKFDPVFHTGKVKFDVAGETITVKDMEFRSDLLTVRNGRGTVTLFGDIDLRLDPEVRTIDIPALSDIWNLLRSELIYRMSVRGTLSRPEATLDALPFLHESGPKGPRVVPEFEGEFRPLRGRRF